MAHRPPLKTEQILYFGILLLALALRFGRLGAPPLNEFEAQAALPAYQLAQGASPDLGDQPAYVLLTGLTFFLIKSSEFLARIWPAIFGSVFVLLPYFWRDLLGRRAALLLSLALALDPGFVAVSRLASGRMLALAAFLIALTAWRYGRPVVTGVFTAFALLSAPTVYIGLVGGVLVWALFFTKNLRIDTSKLRPALISAAATLLFGATFFFNTPQGLAGIGNLLSGFLAGWTASPLSGSFLTRAIELLFALITYGFPALAFGLIAAAKAWRRRESSSQILSLWAFANLIILLIYPGRQVADLIWVVLPLWALAAMKIAHYVRMPAEEPRAAFGEAGLMLLLLAFLMFTLTKTTLTQSIPEIVGPYLFLAGGVVLLGVLATILVAFGWSRQAAASGLVWALGLFFLLVLLSDSTRPQRGDLLAANDLWAPGPAAGENAILANTLNGLSSRNTGQPLALPVDLRVESAALQWALRDLPQDSAQSPQDQAPPIIITLASGIPPAEIDSYRGQSFALQIERVWQPLPPNLISWLLYRQGPTLAQQAILWVNVNLFPDSGAGLQTQDNNTQP